MAHIELRDLEDDDRDAAFTALQESASAWPRVAVGDRDDFDAWTESPGVTARAIVSDSVVVGVAAALDVDGDREVLLALAPSAPADAPTEALRLLTALEPERPLYACVAADDDPSHAVLARLGFVEHGVDGADIVYVLPPTLE